MTWYAETKSFDGRWVSATYLDYPPDRSVEGRVYTYNMRVEVATEHEGKSLDELRKIYGSGRLVFKSRRRAES